MQITNNLLSSIASDSRCSQTATKASSRPSQAQDQVQISSQESPSKLSQLQASYEAGTYNVSPAQIANSILNAML
jgi:hypothetical protein